MSARDDYRGVAVHPLALDEIDRLRAENAEWQDRLDALNAAWLERNAKMEAKYQAMDEIDRLRAWKVEASWILNKWEVCHEVLLLAGCPARLGELKPEHVLRWIKSQERP